LRCGTIRQMQSVQGYGNLGKIGVESPWETQKEGGDFCKIV